MEISRLLNESVLLLKKAKIEDPAHEAGLILSWALKKPLSYIYAHSERELNTAEVEFVAGLVSLRCKGEPFQYITGECEFLSLNFKVSPNVLIPRSDTEILAEAVIYALGHDMPFVKGMFRLGISGENPKRVLDIGTGSGCLAIGIAYYAKNAIVDALDISENALSCARENAERSGVLSRVNFIRADIFDDIRLINEPYDIIVSNPPYIPEAEETMLPVSVKGYEPHSALFAGNGGFSFYERIAALSGRKLAKGGILAVECGYNQADRVSSMFSGLNMETTILKDLSGIGRVVAARNNV